MRDYTRTRTDLTQERTRYWSRLEKLLEDALIKVSSVASKIDGMSVRDMVEALIAGERDPWVLAGLARGRLKAKRTALIPALNGQFDEHHAELARILLDQIDGLSSQIGKLTARIEELVAGLPAAAAPAGGGEGEQPALPAVERLRGGGGSLGAVWPAAGPQAPKPQASRGTSTRTPAAQPGLPAS